MDESIQGKQVTLSIPSTMNMWSTLPKRLINQIKDSSFLSENTGSLKKYASSYNIQDGALSIRRKKFPKLEVTIGSRQMDRSNNGRDVHSVVLEPIGKLDQPDHGIPEFVLFFLARYIQWFRFDNNIKLELLLNLISKNG